MLWAFGLILLGLDLAVLRKQLALVAISGPASISYKRVSLLGRVLGGGLGLLVIVILYLMVFKPGI